MAWQVAREELQGQLVEISQKFAAARGYLSSIYGMVARRGQVLIYSHVTVGLKWCTPEDDERWSAGEDSESIFFGVLKKYFFNYQSSDLKMGSAACQTGTPPDLLGVAVPCGSTSKGWIGSCTPKERAMELMRRRKGGAFVFVVFG